MTAEDWHEKIRRMRHDRIRRVKRLLRPLPRRATVHRYPFLKWFSRTARKRSYLWSFRRQQVIPAIYIGTMLSLMPIYGIQIPTAFILALALRCNLMIMIATQLLTNPITFVPLYTLACFIGLQVLYVMGTEIPGGSAWDFAATVASHLKEMVASMVGPSTPMKTVESLVHATGMSGHELVALAFKSTVIGGAILGYLIGFVLSFFYQAMAEYYQRSHRTIQLQFDEFAKKKRIASTPSTNRESIDEKRATGEST